MAGQKSNTIEYVFQGNVLDLEQAIKKVSSLLTQSAKRLKEYQDGTLTAQQEAELKSTRALLKQLRAVAKEEKVLSADQKRRALAAGKEALQRSQKFSAQSVRVELKAQEMIEKEKQRLMDLTTVAGQENVRQHAAFLDAYAGRLKNYLSPEAYDEIKQAVADYNAALQSTTLTEREKLDVYDQVQKVYRRYAETLQTTARVQQTTNRSIESFNDLMRQTKRHLSEAVNSFGFWLNLARQAIRILKQGVEDAAAYAESINYLSVVAGRYTGELENFIKLQERAFGADPTQLRTTAAMFYQIGTSLGWTDQKAVMLSKNFTQLAQDMASLMNIDLESATEKLRAGLTGQARALAAWGISVHDATIEQWLLEKGLKASMSSMNEADQVAARYAYILEKTTGAQGDLARTIKSPANQFRILNTQTKLLIQNLGAVAIPTFTSFARVLNAVLLPINAFLTALTTASTANFTSSVGENTDALEGLEDQSEDTQKAIRGLANIDEINQISDPKVDSSDLTGISDEIAALLKDYDNLADKGNGLTEIFGALGEVMSPIFEMLTSSPIQLTGALEDLGIAGDKIVGVFEAVGGVLDKLPQPVKDIIGFFGQIAGTAMTVAAAITLVKVAMGSKIFSTFAGILGGILINTAKLVVQTGLLAVKTIAAATAQWWHNASLAAKITLIGGVAAVAVAAGALALAYTFEQKKNEAPEVPAMATGGVATGPTLALVGEGRYDEAVMPLGNSPQFRSMKQEIAAETSRQVAGAPFGSRSKGSSLDHIGSRSSSGRPIILQLNGREVARGLLPEISATQDQVGVIIR